MKDHVFRTVETGCSVGTKDSIVKNQKVRNVHRSGGRCTKELEVRRDGVLSLANKGDHNCQAVFVRLRLVKTRQVIRSIVIFTLAKKGKVYEYNCNEQARQSRRVWGYRDDGSTRRTGMILIVSSHDCYSSGNDSGPSSFVSIFFPVVPNEVSMFLLSKESVSAYSVIQLRIVEDGNLDSLLSLLLK